MRDARTAKGDERREEPRRAHMSTKRVFPKVEVV